MSEDYNKRFKPRLKGFVNKLSTNFYTCPFKREIKVVDGFSKQGRVGQLLVPSIYNPSPPQF